VRQPHANGPRQKIMRRKPGRRRERLCGGTRYKAAVGRHLELRREQRETGPEDGASPKFRDGRGARLPRSKRLGAHAGVDPLIDRPPGHESHVGGAALRAVSLLWLPAPVKIAARRACRPPTSFRASSPPNSAPASRCGRLGRTRRARPRVRGRAREPRRGEPGRGRSARQPNWIARSACVSSRAPAST
jgi:hypothetical protein